MEGRPCGRPRRWWIGGRRGRRGQTRSEETSVQGGDEGKPTGRPAATQGRDTGSRWWSVRRRSGGRAAVPRALLLVLLSDDGTEKVEEADRALTAEAEVAESVTTIDAVRRRRG